MHKHQYNVRWAWHPYQLKKIIVLCHRTFLAALHLTAICSVQAKLMTEEDQCLVALIPNSKMVMLSYGKHSLRYNCRTNNIMWTNVLKVISGVN